MTRKNRRLDWKNFPWHSLVFLLSTLAMIGLGIAGFIVPPTGEIHQSVFQYGCLLCVPLVVSQIRPVLQEASWFKTTFGKFSVEGKSKPQDEPPN